MDSSQDLKVPLFYVSKITKNIRSILEANFSYIGIQGELSSLTRHSSGHWYFTLKDTESQIKGVMFRGAALKVKFEPKVGEEVIVWGRITVYEPRGDYQILSQKMEKLGDGALKKSFEILKEKLKKEGLFEKKRPLPYLPKNLALITSPSGAAIKDILNVFSRRFRGAHLFVVPALMEGSQAPASVILALRQALKIKNLDLVVVTRGGGSHESLWVFNDEELIREAYKCPVPLVSAIGHEIDFTLMDFVADLRAPTPSAAAEIISQKALDILNNIQAYKKNLYLLITKNFEALINQIDYFKRSVASPLSRVQDDLLKCDDFSARLIQNIKNIFEQKTSATQAFLDLLTQLNPRQIMSRGYSLCLKGGVVIKDASLLKLEDEVQIHFHKGKAKAAITD